VAKFIYEIQQMFGLSHETGFLFKFYYHMAVHFFVFAYNNTCHM